MNEIDVQNRIGDVVETMKLLDSWDEKYSYLIELGELLEPMSENDKNDKNLVPGCVSQVWMTSKKDKNVMCFSVDSDALIVRGLLSIIMMMFNRKSPKDILSFDADRIFDELGLLSRLSPNRRNGLVSVIGRVKDEARLVGEL